MLYEFFFLLATCVVAAVPAFSIVRTCRTKGLEPRYFLVFFLSLVFVLLMAQIFYHVFTVAGYEVVLRFDPEYCVANRFQCQLADLAFGNSWWISPLVAVALTHRLLYFILMRRPQALSRGARN